MVDTNFTNSYVLTDAILEAWIGGDPRSGSVAFKALAAASQEWYCQMATRSIDRLPLQGFKLLDSQTRQFPRKYPPSEYNSPWGSILIEDAYGYIYDSVDVPQDVIDACCEEALAIYLANQDPMGLQVEKMQARGATSASIGSEGSETWSLGSKNIRGGLKSEEAYNLLSKYISRSSAIV